MKTILRKGMAACAAVLVSANVVAQNSMELKKELSGNVPLINHIDNSLTHDGKIQILEVTEKEYVIYNSNFEVLKTINREMFNNLQTPYVNYDGGSNYGTAEASISQKLFNDNEEYEYICGIVKSYDQYGTPKYTGIKVVSEGGETLFEYNDESISLSFSGVAIWQIEGERFLVLVTIDAEKKYTTHIFKINRETTRVQEIRRIKGAMNIAPTIADCDAQITITLNEENSNVARELVVTGVNGQLVGRRDIPAGENSVQIPASMLRSGMYNFTLQQKGQVVDNGKVIVK